MRIWADIYNATGSRLGDGPVQLTSASFTRVLDGAGQFTLGIVASDPRALTLIQNERRVRVYIEQNDAIREVGRGIIRDIRLSAGATLSRNVSGIDALDELKRRNTLIALKYKQRPLGIIVQRLIERVPGWTVSVSSTITNQLMDARFDGASILRAFQDIAKNRGVHFRLADGANTVEWGNFGALRTDVYALNTEGGLVDPSPNALIIERVDISDTSEDVVNYVLPIGGGEGEAAALTLQRSTRTSPYAIRQRAAGKKTLYYIADDTSIATYGQIERVLKFTDIAPLSNARQDVVDAANALYDAAVAELQRIKDFQRTYRLTVRNVTKTIRPGDKLNVRYKGLIYRDGQEIAYADFNEDLYVVKVVETVNLSGVSLALDVSTQDRIPDDPAQKVVQTMETVELKGLKPIVSASRTTFSFTQEIDTTRGAVFSFEITDATLDVQRVYMRLQSRYARTHKHVMFSDPVDTTAPTAGQWFQYLGIGENQSLQTVKLPNTSLGGEDTLMTDINTAQTALASIVPNRVRIRINGVDRTAALGGPWSTGNTTEPLDVVLNVDLVTQYIKESSNGLQSRHTVEITCNQYYGEVLLTVEVYEVLQSIVLDDDYET